MCLFVLPFSYIFRKICKSLKKKQPLMAAAAEPLPKTPPKKRRAGTKKSDKTKAVAMTAMDLINLKLCMVEFDIYSEIDPVPPLTLGELKAAMRQLDKMRYKLLPQTIKQ